ncbi:MAG: 1,4-dihydroxy-2-naphthoate octaprenyltransferase, partial [Flavobacteriales bacterium]|nr:1,4-dihydroxy-2-naphthoate octaprenyltransferase [Flavobacteriales bacterium]
VQSGLISADLMKRGIISFVILSLTSGILLIYHSFSGIWNMSFFSFLVLGVLAIYAAINYTVGKHPYGYAGLGDLFVLIFFGWIAVIGTAYLHDAQFSIDLFLPASTIGLLSVGVLNLNNMRDAAQDKIAGKNTMASRFGESKSKKYHTFVIALAILCSMTYMSLHYSSPFQWTYLIFTIPIILHGKRVWNNKIPAHLDPELKKLALSTLLFSIIYGIAVLYPLIFENYI